MANALYRQVSRDLLDRIADDGFEKGAMLPSEAELCEEYGVSRITIRAAIGQLVEKGLLVRRPGVGTFVTGRRSTAREFNLVGFLEEARLFASEPLTNTVIAADADLAKILDLPDNSPVRHIRTAVHREGEPLTVADGYSADSPDTRLSEEDYRRPVASAFAIGIRTRRKVHRAEQVLEPFAATGEVARLLDLDEGTPIIRARRVYFTLRDKPIYYLEVHYHPSRYSFNVDLVLRDGSAEIGFIAATPGTG
ncbi:GntR family transcriptional regulator [Pseudooceanicola sp.]|uniref:GntR family transcriptional regulator n=1 Tax=Pseudooceanicola sp. TaxID=1914328 RepID=UPI0026214DD7|nr:GntR family transcriptional regulator [Pseudooceanicola sp.]MDF1856735.1 GntR family transcriptional regulator [Pseudooceanicola sp.]